MITTIALAVLAILLVPAFTSQRIRPTATTRDTPRKRSRFSAELADITYATRRIRELQTDWPIERAGAAEPQPYSLYSDF